MLIEIEFMRAFSIGKSIAELYIDGMDTEVEGQFRWLTSGTELTYTNWADGEPNNSGDIEDCVTLWSSNGKWNDQSCAKRFSSVCEIKRKYTLTFIQAPTM